MTTTPDVVTVTDSSIDSINTLTDEDTVTITNSTLNNGGISVDLRSGNDIFTFNSGVVNGEVRGGDGVDTLRIIGGTIDNEVFGMNGDDGIALFRPAALRNGVALL